VSVSGNTRYDPRALELIPKALVVGVLAAIPPGAADTEKVNRIWMQLSRRMGYRQMNQTSEGATFAGAGPDDALVIQPPLLQFRSPAAMGFHNAADDAQVCLKTAADQLGAAQLANLGIRHVAHVPAPNSDARAFVDNQLVKSDADQIAVLERGGSSWSGIKYWAKGADGSTYQLTIEPLVADDKFLFLDLDAQFPGQAELDRVEDRAGEAARYVTENVLPYLESAAKG
jgi:hypothetical protein